LMPRAVRHLAHHYFAKNHGWLIVGLEPHSMSLNVTEVHQMTILQDKVPALVEALLEDRQSGRGLLLPDVVAMVAALERLIFDESIKLLVAAYALNDFLVTEQLYEADLHEVLKSYLLVFGAGNIANPSDTRWHWTTKISAERTGGPWHELFDFANDMMLNFGYARQDSVSPFESPYYAFEAAAQIVESMAQGYGRVQKADCREMKTALMELDPSGSGRVTLGAFYAAPAGSSYNFSESAKYLRDIGALDESLPHNPRVRITNYLLGPSNCIASSTYYSVCCLSECEDLMSDLEGLVQAPTLPADRLLGLVSNLSSSSVEAPRQMPRALVDQLQVIADRHGGEVPLHGRLFAQWLHYAFPNECPHPQNLESTASLMPDQWSRGSASASREEAESHIHAGMGAGSAEEGAGEPQWSDEEVLPLHEPTSARRGMFGTITRVAMQLASFVVVLRAAVSAWQRAVSARHGGGGFKGKASALPLYC